MDLKTQGAQGEFSSCLMTSQLGTWSRAEPSNVDYQPMYCSDKVLNPYRVGLDLNTQEDQAESNSSLMISQSGAWSRAEPSYIDFSKSLTQLQSSLGNLNENPMEGFGIVAGCSDNWRLTMGSGHTNHKDRLLKLEHNMSAMNTAIQNTQSLNLGVQAEHSRIEAMVKNKS